MNEEKLDLKIRIAYNILLVFGIGFPIVWFSFMIFIILTIIGVAK